MNKILVCTDGSDYAQICCRYAAWLAARSGACIDLLYLTDIRQFEVPFIADLSGSLGIQPYQDIISQLQEMERKKALMIEETSRQVLAAGGHTTGINFHHRTGLLVDCLGDFERDVDLVMIGKRGENADFASEHLGSTMERVLRASKKPCLVTSRNFREIGKIMLAYDGGQSCRKALQYLTTEGWPTLGDANFHITTVVENGDEAFAQKCLGEAESVSRAAGYSPVCQLLHGHVEETLSGYVEKEGIDLLVMGAYGHTRIRYLLIGSATTDTILGCKIPVLCYR